MLERNMVHLIGSDAHNRRNRNFCLKPALEIIKNIGLESEELVKNNPIKVIKGHSISVPEIKDLSTKKLSFYKKFISKIW